LEDGAPTAYSTAQQEGLDAEPNRDDYTSLSIATGVDVGPGTYNVQIACEKSYEDNTGRLGVLAKGGDLTVMAISR
jgi:hypothetical protein